MVLHMIEADLCESSFLIPSRDMVVGSLVSCFRLFFFCLFLVKGLLRVRSPFQPHVKAIVRPVRLAHKPAGFD